MFDPQLLRSGLGLALALTVGLAGGWLFYRIWRGIMPQPRSREFWRRLPENVVGMLRSEEPDVLFRHYKILLISLAGFAGRNTLAVVAGLVPVTLGFFMIEGLGGSERPATILDRPLLPWLSDFELGFFLAVVAGSAIAAWAARRTRGAAP